MKVSLFAPSCRLTHQVYLAGPLFSQAERDWLDVVAARLRGLGIAVFVPHEAFSGEEVWFSIASQSLKL